MKELKLKEILDFGIPRACYCRTNINHVIKQNEVSGFIITGLTNACTVNIIQQFIKFFGKSVVVAALKEYKSELNKTFYQNVIKVINDNY